MPGTDRKLVQLEKVHLKGFKSIEDLSVDIMPGLNILIGQNGSGKSNFLEFLSGVFSRFFNRTTSYSELTAQYSFGETNFSISFEKKRELKSSPIKVDLGDEFNARVVVNDVLLYNSISSEFAVDQESLGIFKQFVEEVTSIVYPAKSRHIFHYLRYELEPLLIKFGIPEPIAFFSAPGIVEVPMDTILSWEWTDTVPFLDRMLFDMESNISNVDRLIKGISKEQVLSHLEIDEEIISNLSLFTPIKGVRLNESFGLYDSEKNIIIDNLRFDFLVNGHWIPWSYLSDGTKRLFYIVSEITYKKTGLVLIEEPELGVHPHQFHLLMTFLKEQAVHKQIIISTHSPKALDILEQDELDHILITSYNPEQGTQIRRMTELQEKKARGYMKELYLSDYWLMSDLEGGDEI